MTITASIPTAATTATTAPTAAPSARRSPAVSVHIGEYVSAPGSHRRDDRIVGGYVAPVAYPTLAERIDVRLFTPGIRGGRPFSLAVVPDLSRVPKADHDRVVPVSGRLERVPHLIG